MDCSHLPNWKISRAKQTLVCAARRRRKKNKNKNNGANETVSFSTIRTITSTLWDFELWASELLLHQDPARGIGVNRSKMLPRRLSAIFGGLASNAKTVNSELLPTLKVQTDKEVYRPGDQIVITIEISNPSNNGDMAYSLLIERLGFEIKGIEKLDSQWFATQKPTPGSKQRRGSLEIKSWFYLVSVSMCFGIYLCFFCKFLLHETFRWICVYGGFDAGTGYQSNCFAWGHKIMWVVFVICNIFNARCSMLGVLFIIVVQSKMLLSSRFWMQLLGFTWGKINLERIFN